MTLLTQYSSFLDIGVRQKKKNSDRPRGSVPVVLAVAVPQDPDDDVRPAAELREPLLGAAGSPHVRRVSLT